MLIRKKHWLEVHMLISNCVMLKLLVINMQECLKTGPVMLKPHFSMGNVFLNDKHCW